MAERIRAFDWSTTELGPLLEWPASLRSAVQFLLGSPVPLVMLWGKPGHMIYNDAYSEFAGGRHPYLLGAPVELGWPEVADFNRTVVDTCLAGGTLSFRSKALVLLREGIPENVWMDLYYSPVPDDRGQPAGVMAIVVETTGRHRAEQQREAAESAFRGANERLQMALNTGALLGSFVWDIKSNRVSGDERFARTFRFSVEQSQQGLPIEVATQIVHPDDIRHVYDQIALTVDHGTPFNTEYRIRRVDGSYSWILASGRCEYDEEGRPQRFPGVLIDIHERKIAEEGLLALSRDLEQRVAEEVRARLAAEEQLRQSQKLEAIGGLTGGVAHDFNNLLQVIAGNLYLLSRQRPADEAMQRRVRSAITAVERGAKLSSQLLAFARRQPLSPVAYSPERLQEGLSELLQRALGETIQVHMDIQAQPWSLFVDVNQLENAVLNLAINARDAMNGDGVIHLSAKNLTVLPGSTCHAQLPPGEYVELCVRDTGAGMSPQILERAFEPFFTTKPEGHGTGLGLSMVFGFVKQSGGYLDMTSTVGIGTEVSMFFPRTLEQGCTPTERLESPVVGGDETILLVEDDAQVRTTSVELLEQMGYSLVIARHADEAMTALQAGVKIDLIFTDVVMPGQVKSTDLALWAQQQSPRIPVLFTSGHTRDIIAENNQLSDRTFLLSKPYTPEALASMVRAALDGEGRAQPASIFR